MDSEALRLLASNGFLVSKDKEIKKSIFCIRNATVKDVDKLLLIEKACWGDLAAPESVISRRVTENAGNQWAAVLDDEIVGVLCTQRINQIEVLIGKTAHEVDSLHIHQGKYLQLIAVAVLPAFAHLQIGEALRDFVLSLTKHHSSGIDRVIAVTRCSSASPSHDIDSYRAKVKAGDDPTLRFHLLAGAEVVETLPGYRENDKLNFGHGVLVQYPSNDPDNAKKIEKIVSGIEDSKPVVSVEQLCSVISHIVERQFQPDDQSFLSSPLMSLGLDSLRLLELRSMLQTIIGSARSLPTTLLFDYPSPLALLQFLNHGPSDSAVRPMTLNNSNNNKHGINSSIFVTGVACRLPGDVNNIDSLQALLMEGTSTAKDLPLSWQKKLRQTRFACLLRDEQVNYFDAALFGISAHEAQAMDPHQRLLLTLSREALLDAGLLLSNEDNSNGDMKNKKIGVFVGMCNSDWLRLRSESNSFDRSNHDNRTDNELPAASESEMSPFESMAVAAASCANRISFALDLRGPSMVVDTACSSSLTALHLAIKALRAGECDTAVVAAADLLISPHLLQVS